MSSLSRPGSVAFCWSLQGSFSSFGYGGNERRNVRSISETRARPERTVSGRRRRIQAESLGDFAIGAFARARTEPHNSCPHRRALGNESLATCEKVGRIVNPGQVSDLIPNGSGVAKYPRELTSGERFFLENVFKHHQQEGDQSERMGRLRVLAREYATTIMTLCGPGPDRDEALRNVQQAAMWANASVVRCRQ